VSSASTATPYSKPSALRTVGHEDELTLIEHLTELRLRLLVSLAAFGVSFAFWFWQNHTLLRILNEPLHGHRPLTLSPAEAFTTTVTVVAYAAIVMALPVLLYQVYAFMLPALTPGERRVALPMAIAVPVLFVAGAAFAYFLVVPAATKFLLHFNADQFNTQIRARDYYGFMATTLIACGIVFQMPVGVLAATRVGLVTADTLARNRRYAVLVCAVVAAALPGVDPVSMLLEMLPLVLLFELSVLMARLFGGRA
jgi:sec-independent protein translocase protein TatC